MKLDIREAQVKILAQAVYELRSLLSDHLGSTDSSQLCEAVSAHLSYALHNEALAIIEDRQDDFSIEKALESIQQVDEKYGEQFGGRFKELVKGCKI